MLNRVILIGHVGKEPTIHETADGRCIARFSMATNSAWKDKETGEKRQTTQWHQIVIFTPALAEIVKKGWVKSGSKLWVMGTILSREYQNRVYFEVVIKEPAHQLIILDKSEGGRAAVPASEDEYDGCSDGLQDYQAPL